MTKTVKQLIAEGVFGSKATYYFEYLWSHLNKNAKPDDGFGWVCLHSTDSGASSSSGTHRSMRRALQMKERPPFACVLVVWDYEQMQRTVKRYWSAYSTEEKESINETLAGYTLRTEKAASAGRSSPFARWSQRAGQTAPVDSGAAGGGSDSSSAESCSTEQVLDQLTAQADVTPDVMMGARWPFPVDYTQEVR